MHPKLVKAIIPYFFLDNLIFDSDVYQYQVRVSQVKRIILAFFKLSPLKPNNCALITS